MKEAVDNSLSKLTPQDLQAIAIYLEQTKPIARGPQIDPNPPSLAASTFSAPGPTEPDSAGRRLFAGACGAATPGTARDGRRRSRRCAACRR